MTLHTLPDIVGTGVKQRLVATSGLRARWIALNVDTSSFDATVGDVNVAAAQGIDIPQNAPIILPENGADPTDTYDLFNVWVFVAIGATLSITYGV